MEKREILSHWRKNSSNQLFGNFFSKCIAFTKFLLKKCKREFLQFPNCEFLNSHIFPSNQRKKLLKKILCAFDRIFHTLFRQLTIISRESSKTPKLISRKIWMQKNSKLFTLRDPYLWAEDRKFAHFALFPLNLTTWFCQILHRISTIDVDQNL